MSKKDFISLADHIKTSTVPFTQEHLEVLADFCKSQNGRFDRERWLGYIRGDNGPSGGQVTRTGLKRQYDRQSKAMGF